MRRKLTDRFLDSIKAPTEGRDTYSDTLRAGLHLRVGQRKASWVFEKRVKGGAKRKHTLGAWPDMGLAQARAAALEIEAEASKGIDRIADAESARLSAERAAAAQLTLGQVLDRYAELRLANIATGPQVERELRRVLSKHMNRPMAEVSRADLQGIIDLHAGAGHITYANRVRAYLRTLTKWAARRDYTPGDIGFALEGAGREMPRDRVLSFSEVQTIYRATYGLGDLWGPMFRLLLLTGQRRGEIAGLRWGNVNFAGRCIELTGRQTKNRRPHITHLSPPALAELQELLKRRGESDLVFTTTGKTPASGISQAKARLDKLLGDGFEPWRLHDFRRAMATALAGTGVPEGVVDRIQNHAATGSAPSAVARVYQQSDLLPQRAAALNRWAELVTLQTKNKGGEP